MYPENNDDRESSWEEKVDAYIEELEDLGWDWDAHDPDNWYNYIPLKKRDIISVSLFYYTNWFL